MMKANWFCVIPSVLIIVLVWWAPGWANWGITILAALMIVCGLFCGGKCRPAKSMPVGDNQ